MHKLGIFGGTFNPVHNMHLSMATQFLSQMELDECLFVPAYLSPFKTESSEEIVSPEHRLKMLELALWKYDKFKIEIYELMKKGISYTIDTIKYIRTKYPESELFLLIGSDQLKDFTKWKDWELILSQVKLCVVKRHDLNTNDLNFPGLAFIDIPESDISSSKIRAMLRNNQTVSSLVPKEVEDYIINHTLYK